MLSMQWEQLLRVVVLLCGIGMSGYERLVIKAQVLVAFCVSCWLSRLNCQCFKGHSGEIRETFYRVFH